MLAKSIFEITPNFDRRSIAGDRIKIESSSFFCSKDRLFGAPNMSESHRQDAREPNKEGEKF